MKCGELKVDIGCGPDIREGYNVGLDLHDYSELYRIKYKGVEFIQHDLEKASLPFCDNSCEALMADNVLEHIHNLIPLMNDCWRVLKPGGEFYIIVPNGLSEGGIADPTHVRHFIPKTFTYFTKGKRQENYGMKPWIEKSMPVRGEGRIEVVFTPDK
jgi:SAM-dependent methyltransferase